MAAIVPTRFVFSIGGDVERVSVASVIEQKLEQSDNIERVNNLYANANRRAAASRFFVPPIVTTSATYIVLPDWYARMSATRTVLSFVTYASDAVILPQVYNATSGAAIGSMSAHTHATGAATVLTTLYSSISVEAILIRVGVKRSSSSTTIHAIRALEVALVAADLPT